MSWETWVKAWTVHAQTSLYRRRVESAIGTVRSLLLGTKYFCGLSGGKDGVATAGLLKLAGRGDIPLVHVYTPLNVPGMEDTAKNAAQVLGMKLTTIEPDLADDFWKWLKSLPAPITSRANYSILGDKIAVGNMLVAYTYEHKFDGSINGMRAEESKGRRINRKVRGRAYRLKVDGKEMVQPIVDWQARDVFAFCLEHGLPICDHYRLAYERFGLSPESPNSRVDCVIVPDEIACNGTYAMTRQLYPELWRQLVAARPDLLSRY